MEEEKSYDPRDTNLRFVNADDDHDFACVGYRSQKALMSCGHSVTPQSLSEWCLRQLQEVEHRSNRAVIIDLGLAKFFKNGLNSAADMGNLAYSAPEVLLGLCQRDQRSDVWAMGKVIAELLLLRRLKTKEVQPSTVKMLLQRSPYRHLLCAMVQQQPTDRAAMTAVVREPALTFVDSDGDHSEGVPMSCGHMVTSPASLACWSRRQLRDGKSRLQCGVCNTTWSLSEVTDAARFTDEQRSSVEAALNKNHTIIDLRARSCPGCASFVLRKDPENLCVRCPQCTADGKADHDFCWQCLKKWRGPAPRSDHCENEGCVALGRT